jgi:hypothetical protein
MFTTSQKRAENITNARLILPRLTTVCVQSVETKRCKQIVYDEVFLQLDMSLKNCITLNHFLRSPLI